MFGRGAAAKEIGSGADKQTRVQTPGRQTLASQLLGQATRNASNENARAIVASKVLAPVAAAPLRPGFVLGAEEHQAEELSLFGVGEVQQASFGGDDLPSDADDKPNSNPIENSGQDGYDLDSDGGNSRYDLDCAAATSNRPEQIAFGVHGQAKGVKPVRKIGGSSLAPFTQNPIAEVRTTQTAKTPTNQPKSTSKSGRIVLE